MRHFKLKLNRLKTYFSFILWAFVSCSPFVFATASLAGVSARAQMSALVRLRLLYLEHLPSEYHEIACEALLTLAGTGAAIRNSVGPNMTLSSGAKLSDVLTPQALKYLELRSQGLSNPEIAEALNVQVATIYQRRTRIYKHLDAAGEKVGSDLDGWLLKRSAIPTPE